MELAAQAGVLQVGELMNGQGKQMPGMVARDSDSDPGVGTSVAPAVPETGAAAPLVQPVVTARVVDMPASGEGFDIWLHAELSRLYDAALAEPLPEDMIRLLHDAARKR